MDFQKELEELKEEFNQKVADLENKYKKENNNAWMPKDKEDYYIVTAMLESSDLRYHNDEYDKKYINAGNCFRTKEDAERKAFEIKLHRKLEIFAEENNDKDVRNNNASDNKYCIEFCDCLEVECVGYRRQGTVYFSSREIAEKAIEIFEEDLTRYFTSNK